jgi:hypothetical protein
MGLETHLRLVEAPFIFNSVVLVVAVFRRRAGSVVAVRHCRSSGTHI